LSADGDVVGAPIVVETSPPQDAPWPVGELVSLDEIPDEVDQEKLEAAIVYAFAEPHSDNPIKTRSVVIVYDGRIIAERYAPGFSQDTPQVSWSMAKSVISALVGILVGEDKLSLEEPVQVPEWSDPGDSRHVITLDQLLRMSSGLEFEEMYGDRGVLASATSDVSVMLFNTSDMAAFAAAKPLEADPDTLWHYSSGTSNIVSQIVCDTVGGTPQDCLVFPRRELFDRIGMHSAVFEPDTVGTPVGSSFVYASARDWARFGLLYLQDGVWEGERILPEGWVAYTTTPTPGSEGLYGAHWWLNSGDGHGWYWPDNLPDLFMADGHDGQFVIVVPSHNLVIVRLAFTQDPEAFNLGAFVEKVLEAIPESK
jgi:CubicO group peptidase (beta-lactamase class C family)